MGSFELLIPRAFSLTDLALFLFPESADTIKSKMQTDDITGSGSRQSFVQVARGIWAKEGVRGFYKGLGITLFRAMPASGGIFLTYELLRRNVSF